MKGGSGGAGGVAVQVAPPAPRPLVSPLPPPLQGAQQQRLHFNYQVHLVLLMGHRLGGSEPADVPACKPPRISNRMFTMRYSLNVMLEHDSYCRCLACHHLTELILYMGEAGHLS